MQEAKAQCIRSAMMIFNQNIIFWLMLLSTQPTSVFQIHLNRFDHYQRRPWMLITVKALTLLSGGQNWGKKISRVSTLQCHLNGCMLDLAYIIFRYIELDLHFVFIFWRCSLSSFLVCLETLKRIIMDNCDSVFNLLSRVLSTVYSTINL